MELKLLQILHLKRDGLFSHNVDKFELGVQTYQNDSNYVGQKSQFLTSAAPPSWIMSFEKTESTFLPRRSDFESPRDLVLLLLGDLLPGPPFPPWALMNLSLVVRLGHIQCTEPGITTKIVQNVLDSRNRVTIRDSFQIQFPEIQKH